MTAEDLDQNNEEKDVQPIRSRRRILKIAASAFLLSAGVGAWFWKSRWQYIVIHHSAGDYGNIEFLQKVHRQRQAGDIIDAIPYHFIVGNGNGMAIGEIASDWRQQNSIWGAHVSTRNPMRNFLGLGICLIGNYDQGPVPEKQFDALVKLCISLAKEFDIPIENINGHGLIAGEQTLCPGKFLSIDKVRQDVASGLKV